MTTCTFAVLVAALSWAGEDTLTRTDVEKRLLGEWIGVAGHWGQENPPPSARQFVFLASNRVEVVIGKDRVMGTYQIDATKRPFHIDFTFEVDGKKVRTMTIFDFPAPGQLRMAEWDPDFRRDNFQPGITFERRKPASKAGKPVP